MKARAHRALAGRVRLRSAYDREILSLAVPALGALAAEPLYLLADTAMVGHLGTEELAALAIAATLLAGTFTLFNFLTYGTTAQVARYHGAGDEPGAGRLAAQSLWLSAGIGVRSRRCSRRSPSRSWASWVATAAWASWPSTTCGSGRSGCRSR
jgi:Na+-driven multidrug efflux pump